MKNDIEADSSDGIGLDISDFPLESRISSYTLSLLSLRDMHPSVLDMAFEVLPRNAGKIIFENIKKEKPYLLDSFLDNKDKYLDNLTKFISKNFEDQSEAFRIQVIEKISLLLKNKIRENPSSYEARIHQICTKLNLHPDEVTLLEFGSCYHLCRELENIFDSYNHTLKTSLLSTFTGLSCDRILELTSKNGNLSRNNLLSLDKKDLEIDFEISNYLVGISGKDLILNHFARLEKAQLELEAFDLSCAQKRTLDCILQSNSASHILFYGESGAGKTELAKTLAQSYQLDAILISSGDESSRKKALISASNTLPAETLIVVDEIDSLLNTKRLFSSSDVDKAWINDFLDNAKHRFIWITNESKRIEESVCRRFNYSLHFKSLNWKQRSNIWERQLRKERIKRFFSAEDILYFARNYPLSPGIISNSIRSLASYTLNEMSSKDIHEILRESLGSQMKLTLGQEASNELVDMNENYDLQSLNTDVDISHFVEGLKKWEISDSKFGLNILFWGWPGTGKTEFAKYIAKQLNKELLVKRVSDLQSKYVGETEQHIAETFKEAQENNNILFLDETDSLLMDRKSAHRSWETNQTNEILTQMENFSGILLCSTNLLDRIDEAAMRRFAFKIKFLPLTEEGRLQLYQKYFSTISRELKDTERSRISKLSNLCPGDIKCVWQRMHFLAELSHSTIIEELEKEIQYKKGVNDRAIGF